MDDFQRQIETRVSLQFRRGNRIAALILAVLMGALLAHALAVPGHPTLLRWGFGLSATAFLAVFLLGGRVSPEGGHVEDMSVLLALVGTVHATLVMVALPNQSQTTNFLLVQVGSALAFRSHLRFALVQVINVVAWLALNLRAEPAYRPDHWPFAIASAVALALGIHLFVAGGVRRLVEESTRAAQLLHHRRILIGTLRRSLARARTLRGLVPICAQCKKVRDDGGFWQAVERYLESRSEVVFTHGLCPDCGKAAIQEWRLKRP